MITCWHFLVRRRIDQTKLNAEEHEIDDDTGDYDVNEPMVMMSFYLNIK
jgi:hypothetical protein